MKPQNIDCCIACEDYRVTEDQLDLFLKDGSLREVQVRIWCKLEYRLTGFPAKDTNWKRMTKMGKKRQT